MLVGVDVHQGLQFVPVQSGIILSGSSSGQDVPFVLYTKAGFSRSRLLLEGSFGLWMTC